MKSHQTVFNASFIKSCNIASDPSDIGDDKNVTASNSNGATSLSRRLGEKRKIIQEMKEKFAKINEKKRKGSGKRRNETSETDDGVKSKMIECKARKGKRRKTVDGEKDMKANDVKVSNPRKKKRRKVAMRNQWFGIRTRSSPHQLFLAISFMNKRQNKRQRDLIRSMGFGKLLSFQVDSIPSKLGHYVVDMLDTDNMEINLGETKIKVDKESIHGLLGIPNGGIDLGTVVKHTERDPIKRRWRGRYGKLNIGPSDIVNKMIENDYDEDMIFKIDFLILFCSTMLACQANGKCKFGVLDYVSMDTDLKDYDWCGYVVDAIRGSKKEWRRCDLSSVYTGPLTILTLLYVDRISCPGMNDERSLSPIAFWTKERLGKREDEELRHGGFGLGDLRELYADDPNYDSHEEENIRENTECENAEDNSLVVFDNTYQTGHLVKLDSPIDIGNDKDTISASKDNNVTASSSDGTASLSRRLAEKRKISQEVKEKFARINEKNKKGSGKRRNETSETDDGVKSIMVERKASKCKRRKTVERKASKCKRRKTVDGEKYIKVNGVGEDVKVSNPGKKKRKKVGMRKKWFGIRTRSSPHQLCLAMSFMNKRKNKRQRDLIRSMGFGKLLSFQVDGIPSKLGHYVVDMLDTDNMEINLGETKIKVDKESIHGLLGIPNGGIDLGTVVKHTERDPIKRRWRGRYGKLNIGPSDIVNKMIENDYDEDMIFKIDFLILFCSTMLACQANGKCKFGVLDYVSMDTDLKDYDWCGYVVDAIRGSKKEWRRCDLSSVYTGPLTILTLLYVDRISCPGMNDERSLSPIAFWTKERLGKWEDEELRHGGFGLGDLRELYADDPNYDSHEEENIRENTECENAEDNSLVVFDNTYQTGHLVKLDSPIYIGNVKDTISASKDKNGTASNSDGAASLSRRLAEKRKISQEVKGKFARINEKNKKGSGKRRNETSETDDGVKSIMVERKASKCKRRKTVEPKASKCKRRKAVDGEKNIKVNGVGEDVKVSNPGEKKRKKVAMCKKWFGIHTRSSPHQLCLAMSFMNKRKYKRQRDLIRSMGFGKLLSFQVDGIPSKLGHYVVDMLDIDNMEINLGETKIKVDKESIHGLLGIPNGGIDLGTVVKHTERDPIKRRWRGRYGKLNIGPSEIVNKMIENDYDEDMIFKIDFLILFCSTMLACQMNGKCKFGVLDYVSLDTDLKDYDWCAYAVDAIRGSKKEWRRCDLSSVYTGPLTILTLLYVDRIYGPGMNDERSLSPIAFWTKERLGKRQDEELRHGGFGLGKLRELYADDHNYDSHEEENILENTKCENAEDNSFVVIDDICLTEHLAKLDSMYQSNVKDKLDFEAALCKAKNLFPESSEVSEFVRKYKELYKVCVDFEAVEVGKAKPSLEPSSSCTMNSARTPRETTGKPELPNEPETWTEAAINVEEIETSLSVKSTTHDGIKKYNMTGEIPSFSLGLTQNFPEVGEKLMASDDMLVTKKENEERQKNCGALVGQGKRVTRASAVQCSPFLVREVDLDTELNKKEKMILNYLMAGLDDVEKQEQGKDKENLNHEKSSGKQAVKERELVEKREVETDNKLCSGQGCGESVHESTTEDKIESGSNELADFQFEVSTKIHNHVLPYVNKLHDHRNRGQDAVFFDGQDRLVKVVSFVSSLLDNIKKPILIIASSIALSLWEIEFSKWSKSINVVTYTGNKDIRDAIRGSEFQVLLSSPDAIVEDMEMLVHIKWELLVVDECQHPVISTHLKIIQKLMAEMRLLTVSNEPVDISQNYRNILSLVDCRNEKIYSDADMEMNDDIGILKERLSPFIAFECNLKRTQRETSSVNVLQIPASSLVRPKNPCLTSDPTTNLPGHSLAESGLRVPAPHLTSSPSKFASFGNQPVSGEPSLESLPSLSATQTVDKYCPV